MIKKNYTFTLILVAALFAVPASADLEFGIGHTANAVRTDLSECSGQCDFSRDGSQTPLELVLSSYYTGPIDIGAELYFPGDPAAALMLRRKVGKMAFALGAGISHTEIRVSRGDNTNVGDGSMSSTDTRPFYVATFRYGVGNGAIVASYARSTGDMDFNGFVVTNTTTSLDDEGNTIITPEITDTSANIDVDRSYVRIGYEFRF